MNGVALRLSVWGQWRGVGPDSFLSSQQHRGTRLVAMLAVDERGLACAVGGFHIDPSKAVDRALITHAHSDHARAGSKAYLCSTQCVELLRLRLGRKAVIQGVPYGEVLDLNGVRVSFHPAGHVLGSAQIRLEHGGEVWVVSGDYKTQPDPTSAAFEPVRCHTFVTESTFGLPVYQWPDPRVVFEEINSWWRENQARGRRSLLFGYSLGKAQRLLAGVDPSIGPIRVHPAIAEFLPSYAAAGVRLPEVETVTRENARAANPRSLFVLPPGGDSAQWFEGAGERSAGFASGWMLLRSARNRRGIDRGFVLSDHVDWPGLVQSIRATGAGRVLVTHGDTGPLVRWLKEGGWDAAPLTTRSVASEGLHE